MFPVIHNHLQYYSFKPDYHVIDAHFYKDSFRHLLVFISVLLQVYTTTCALNTSKTPFIVITKFMEKKQNKTKHRKIIATALSIGFDDQTDQTNSGSPSLDVCLPAAVKMTQSQRGQYCECNSSSASSGGIASNVSNSGSDISILSNVN